MGRGQRAPPTPQREAPWRSHGAKSVAVSTKGLRTGAGRVTACETEAGSSRWHESIQERVRGEEVHLVRGRGRGRGRGRVGVRGLR